MQLFKSIFTFVLQSFPVSTKCNHTKLGDKKMKTFFHCKDNIYKYKTF